MSTPTGRTISSAMQVPQQYQHAHQTVVSSPMPSSAYVSLGVGGVDSSGGLYSIAGGGGGGSYSAGQALPSPQFSSYSQVSPQLQQQNYQQQTQMQGYSPSEQQQQQKLQQLELPKAPMQTVAVGRAGDGSSILQLAVPTSVVGSIIGRGGSNIAQIRNISGARVNVQEVQEGGHDRIVEISGTPEQLQAAQSLLQAFIISGHGAAPHLSAY
eukprot:TRINITY_DN1548_c0_g1_i2.p1 TRINITY_DN1548_c0_g1~~TRINITY_DN1548_c0_g1_i2.p1  ORF type:complete len:238 (-),score=66.73 TRINITY_DN1548_c0_g1_i2:290-925(-)